ncbi:MAG: Rap1a/Tai family immunity protein [Phyllobacterium sp.]|uniref:Rap1a/Tai family immunity protein n=1 Tax=Phyllobacterium sp. TaxID=1871046 RepID=UPI0030F2D568
MRRFLLIAAMVAASILPGNAAYYSGNEIMTKCDDELAFNKGFCLGYFAAVADSWSNSRLVGGPPECLSAAVTVGQIRDVVVKFLRDNPARRHEDTNGLEVRALYLAFCPQ